MPAAANDPLLALEEVAPYLLQHGLLEYRQVVDDGIAIDDASRIRIERRAVSDGVIRQAGIGTQQHPADVRLEKCERVVDRAAAQRSFVAAVPMARIVRSRNRNPHAMPAPAPASARRAARTR